MLGQLAAERGRSPGVREFGQTLVTTIARRVKKCVTWAARFGLRPTRDVTPEAREERDRLAAMGGRRFDREFIRHMIDDHRRISRNSAMKRAKAWRGSATRPPPASNLAQAFGHGDSVGQSRRAASPAILTRLASRAIGEIATLDKRPSNDRRGRNYDDDYRSER
jgi:hypothetical protein